MKRRLPRIASGFLAAAVVAAVVVDRMEPPSPVRPRAVADVTPGGVWGCPVVSAGGRGGFLHLANASLRASEVRVRWIVAELRPTEFAMRLLPGHGKTLRAPVVGDRAVSAIVEWAGGEVVASRSAPVDVPAGRRVAMGAACSRSGDRTLAFVGGRTVNAETRLWVLNPSSADALIDVSLLSEGEELQPETLKRRVVRGRGVLVVRAGDYAFDRRLVGMVVRTTTGTVIADGMIVTQTGADLVPAVPPSDEAVLAGEPVRDGHLDVVAVGEEPATVVSTTLTASTRSTTTAFPSVLDGATPAEVGFRGGGPMAFTLAGREGSPFVASVGWGPPVPGGSDFALSPQMRPSTRWVGVAGPPAAGAGIRLVLANPGDVPVLVHARLLTHTGQAASGALANITLLPGRAAAFPLTVAGQTVGVEVVSESGPVVVLLVGSGGRDSTAFTYAIGGTESAGGSHPAVTLDPATGVSG